MNSHPSTGTPRRRLPRVALITAIVVLALLGVYATAGFILLPWLAERELPQWADTQLRVHGRVADVAFNPFTLRLHVAGFALEEKDGRPLVAAQEAMADVEWRSLTRGAWMLSDLRLTAPAVNVDISEQGRLNLASLLPLPGDKTAPQDPLRVAIGRLQITDGRIDFADRREGYEQRLEQLSLELSSVSTLEAKDGSYKLTAQTPDGAQLRWNGELTLQPFAASGVLALTHSALAQLNPYLDEAIAARIVSGRAGLELPYRLSLNKGKVELEVSNAKLELQDLALALRHTDEPFARIGHVALEGISVDLQARRASAQVLRVADFLVAGHRDGNGAVDIAQLIPAAKDESSGTPWHGGIGIVEFSNGTASFKDNASDLSVRLTELDAAVKGLTSDASEELAFEVAAAIAGGGRIALNGGASRKAGTVQAHIEAKGLPIVPFQSLLAQYAQLKLVSGEASLAGDITAGGEGAKLSYSGSAALSNVTIDDSNGVRLVAWKALSTGALRASVGPARVEIDDLRWVAPAGRLAIAADGSTNIGRLLVRKEAPTAATDQNEEGGGYTATIRRMRVEQGRLDFSDDSLTSGFSARIHDLTGTVNGMSTDRNTRSQLSLEGRVDEHGYARVSGGLNVFEPSERTKVRLQFRNLDVTKVSPYAVKFAGYRIASGRMSLDLAYSVQDNLLQGDNKIVLEHFTLGERVESPSALDLPLELAVALLKDADGVIDVAIPISGNLNDPTFDFGAVIWKAIGNLIGNVISAPFRALGRLFGGGGGEELGAIAFEPGSSRLLPPEREKISRIAEALAKRPELKLQIPAGYDEKADARALKRGALRREIAKRAGFDVKDEDPPGPISIDDQRTRDAVRALFAERYSAEELDRLKAEAEAKAAAGGKEGAKPAAELSVFERIRKFTRGEPQVADPSEFYRTLGRRLVESQPLPDGALQELAQKRAANIGAALREAGVDASRIGETEPRSTANADAKHISLELSLAPSRTQGAGAP